jgi:hypothetical protein
MGEDSNAVQIQLVVPCTIKGVRYEKGARVWVSRWVANAFLGSTPMRAIKPSAPPNTKTIDKTVSRTAPARQMTMTILREMQEAGEWKAARKLMRSGYGVTAVGWDDLLEKASAILDD